ncbi:vacuolar import and degradation protein [Anaeramoeba flamelloides]|uniref:Vacuolar import and degradation protein n=1 Tax=Anaeramoeba flamelloides TaxID=1746091 RepID=A0ABQ8XW96_9EUKA|nr:vacuolar import and degradation protein [Anaeramoeba flamelloides]
MERIKDFFLGKEENKEENYSFTGKLYKVRSAKQINIKYNYCRCDVLQPDESQFHYRLEINKIIDENQSGQRNKKKSLSIDRILSLSETDYKKEITFIFRVPGDSSYLLQFTNETVHNDFALYLQIALYETEQQQEFDHKSKDQILDSLPKVTIEQYFREYEEKRMKLRKKLQQKQNQRQKQKHKIKQPQFTPQKYSIKFKGIEKRKNIYYSVNESSASLFLWDEQKRQWKLSVEKCQVILQRSQSQAYETFLLINDLKTKETKFYSRINNSFHPKFNESNRSFFWFYKAGEFTTIWLLNFEQGFEEFRDCFTKSLWEHLNQSSFKKVKNQEYILKTHKNVQLKQTKIAKRDETENEKEKENESESEIESESESEQEEMVWSSSETSFEETYTDEIIENENEKKQKEEESYINIDDEDTSENEQNIESEEANEIEINILYGTSSEEETSPESGLGSLEESSEEERTNLKRTGIYGNQSDLDPQEEFVKTSKHETNKHLAVGTNSDRSFVLRGNRMGVFKHGGNTAEYLHTIQGISDLEGNDFVPSKLMLHQQDTSALFLNPKAQNTVFKMDIERGEVVESYLGNKDIPINTIFPETKVSQTTNSIMFGGLNPNSIFLIDPRLSKNKIVETQKFQYKPTTRANLSSICTTKDGCIGTGSKTGEIRLFSEINKRAKTLLPGFGDPISAMDVTEDGKWVLATCKDYLLVVNTDLGNGKNGFKVRLGKKKPRPTRLQLEKHHLLLFKGKVNFTAAHFNTGKGGEKSIVTSTGNFVITWNFAKVKNGILNRYEIKKFSDRVVRDDFVHNTDQAVVVALPNGVHLKKKKSRIYKK